jgi:6-phosphogluconate dehydrogenase
MRRSSYPSSRGCIPGILREADAQHGWHLNFVDVLQIWREACIIQSDHIIDLLERVYCSGETDRNNLLSSPVIAQKLQKSYPGLKTTVLRAAEADLHVPALSASSKRRSRGSQRRAVVTTLNGSPQGASGRSEMQAAAYRS